MGRNTRYILPPVASLPLPCRQTHPKTTKPRCYLLGHEGKSKGRKATQHTFFLWHAPLSPSPPPPMSSIPSCSPAPHFLSPHPPRASPRTRRCKTHDIKLALLLAHDFLHREIVDTYQFFSNTCSEYFSSYINIPLTFVHTWRAFSCYSLLLLLHFLGTLLLHKHSFLMVCSFFLLL